MCKICDSLRGMVAVDKDLYHHLLRDSGLVKAIGEPDFTPDETSGEGKASDDELDYRAALLLLLSALYTGAKKAVNSNDDIPEKLASLDNLLDSFMDKAQGVATKYNKTIYQAAIKEANNNLDNLKEDLKKLNPGSSKILPVLDQQHNNIQDIRYYIRGRVSQGLYLERVGELYETEEDEDYLDSAFSTAQTRLDQTGIYGAINARKYGLLETYIAAQVILGVILVSDWLTCEDPNHSTGCTSDGPVCDDCQAMADAGPYPVIAFPGEQHFGDRCEPGPPYIQGT